MKILKRVGILVSALFLSFGAGVCLAQATDTPTTMVTNPSATSFKIAVVNVQQVLQQSPRVADLSKKLEAQFKARQAKISEQQQSLQEALNKFKKEEPTMSQKDKDATQKKIAADRAELVKQVVAYQQDLQKEQTKIMQGILADLNGIVSGIAKNKGYSLVLDSQAVIFADGANDITKEVTQQFNAKA